MTASVVNFVVVEWGWGECGQGKADLLFGSNSSLLNFCIADQTKRESLNLQEKLMSLPRVFPTPCFRGL